MENIKTGNIIIKLASTNDEIIELEKFRYNCLLKDYRQDLEDENGIDNDGYDKYCDHLYAYDEETQKIVGTYRLATYETTKGNPFVTEDEFDITNIRNTNENVLELGRAVVHEDYRNGVVIQLLWAGMLRYALEHNIRFVLGMGSFHGTDVSKYKHAFSHLYYNYRSPEELSTKVSNGPKREMRLLEKEEIDDEKVKEELPGLIRGYLRLGATVSDEICLDLNFNSADVLVLLDMHKLNPRYIARLTRV